MQGKNLKRLKGDKTNQRDETDQRDETNQINPIDERDGMKVKMRQVFFKRIYCKWYIILMVLLYTIPLVSCNRIGTGDVNQGEVGSLATSPVLDHTMELSYATGFSVDYYRMEGDEESSYCLIRIFGEGNYVICPRKENPLTQEERAALTQSFEALIEQDVMVMEQPEQIYLVASQVMDMFVSMNAQDKLKFSALDEKDWYIEEARNQMRDGKLLYAGKYAAPDYELILSGGCDLAIENTMIYHNPEVKEQLEQLDIPVMVEYSSYENHPLGRMEWIKLYGVLIGKEEEAQSYFETQISGLEEVLAAENTGKTVAFFYVNANGAVNVRKSGDYVAKMIELAGGKYVPADLEEGENALSTMNMQMEAFYTAAKDADYLIYNSTIDGELQTLEDLYAKSELFRDFKAVKEGHVWCIGKNMFQESTGLGDMIFDMHHLFSNEDIETETLHYMHRLQ